MATVNDVPVEHRDLAKRMPEDIRDRMDPAELRLRLAEVARLQDQIGRMPDHMTARGASEHAEAMLKALPYTELEERARKLQASATQAPTALDATGFIQAATELRRANPQPQAMTQAADLADAQDGAGNRVPVGQEHRHLATVAEMIRLQRAAIMQGKPPGAVSAKRTGPARERYQPAEVTKSDDAQVVPMLHKAAGASTRDLITKAALQTEVTKAVADAYAAASLDERLTQIGVEIHRTRAEMAGRTSTMGAPITNMRSH